MKTYIKPELEIIRFDVEDVITTSVILDPVTADIEGATVEFQAGWEQTAVTAAELLGN